MLWRHSPAHTAGVSKHVSVAGLLGTSEAMIRKVYGHHAIDHLRDAADIWSKRSNIVGGAKK